MGTGSYQEFAHFESLRVGNPKNEIRAICSWLPLRLIASDAASGSALRRRHPRDDLVSVTLEHDRLAVDEYGMVMALARCSPDNEIPTPNPLAVVFPRTESGVPDVIKTYLSNKSINKFFLPRPGVFPPLTTLCEIGYASRELVERSFIVRAWQTLHVPPFRDVTRAKDLSALPAIAPFPVVVHDPPDTPGELEIAQILALQTGDCGIEIGGVELAALFLRVVDQTRGAFEHCKMFPCADSSETREYSFDKAFVPVCIVEDRKSVV